MIELMLAAALMQEPAGCNAVPATAAPADCPQWRHLSRDRDGDIFVDPASVRRNGDRLEARMRVVNAREQSGRSRSANTRVWIDCVRRQGAALHMTLFATDGAQLGDFDVTGEAARPRVITPGSPSLRILADYCPRPAT